MDFQVVKGAPVNGKNSFEVWRVCFWGIYAVATGESYSDEVAATLRCQELKRKSKGLFSFFSLKQS